MMDLQHEDSFAKSAQLMTDFFPSYVRLKETEGRMKVTKQSIREALEGSDEKRHEFGDMVCKFVAENVYETDYLATNEFLSDLGLLPFTNTLDASSCTETELSFMEMFQLPITYSVRPSFNKKGRVPAVDYSPDGTLPVLAADYQQQKLAFEKLEKAYEKLKWQIAKCEVLQAKKKVSYEYGSISLLAGKRQYDLSQAHQWGLTDMLIQRTRPNSTLLQRYIEKGLLKEQDLLPFKKRVDVRLKFMILSKETEAAMFDHFQQRVYRTSQNLAC